MKAELKSIAIIASVLVSTQAMAAAPSAASNQATKATKADANYRHARGDTTSEVSINGESALERLRQDGRVEIVAAANHSICY